MIIIQPKQKQSLAYERINFSFYHSRIVGNWLNIVEQDAQSYWDRLRVFTGGGKYIHQLLLHFPSCPKSTPYFQRLCLYRHWRRTIWNRWRPLYDENRRSKRCWILDCYNRSSVTSSCYANWSRFERTLHSRTMDGAMYMRIRDPSNGKSN